MKLAVVRWGELTLTGDLLEGFHKIRKQLFVNKLGWELPTFNDFEFDQYDTPAACSVVVYDENRKVIAGTRLIRTTANFNGWSYMIRDASLGRIKTIPSSIIEDPPVSEHVWESTRFTVDASLPVGVRNEALTLVCDGASKFIRSQGGSEVLGLMNPFFLRWLPRAGFPVVRRGPTVSINGQPWCTQSYSTLHDTTGS